MTGTWSLGRDITLYEEEEGAVVEIDNPTGVEEVVVEENHNIHNKGTRNGAVPTITHLA